MGIKMLDGIRILEFSWIIAGPWLGRILASFGAEVIRIESSKRMDICRAVGPFPHGKENDINLSGIFHEYNAGGKLSVTLNLTKPKSIEIAKKLIKVSDVVTDNFSAGMMERFGLGYPVIKEVNPKIIMLSLPAMGQTGPHSHDVSYGPGIQRLSGISSISGFANKPMGTSMSYPDYTSALQGAVAVLSALIYRKKTGVGQHIDLSQYEATVSLIGPALLDYTVNNYVQQRQGNRLSFAAPHNCYPCKGTDRWCVIAVFNDKEWEAFCSVLDAPPWTKEERFSTMINRIKNAEELDRLIGDWTVKRTPEEVFTRMQRAKVPAGIVQNSEDLLEKDPHLRARQFFRRIDSPEMGDPLMDTIPINISGVERGPNISAPSLGSHNGYVFGELLGMSQKEIARLVREEIIV